MGLFERFRLARPAVGDASTRTTQASAVAYFNEGNTHVRSGHPHAALEAYRKALAAKPDFAEAEVATGSVYQQLGRLEEAAASYRRAIQINPNYHEAFTRLGDALMPLGQFEAAAASYERAIRARSCRPKSFTSTLETLCWNAGASTRQRRVTIRALQIKPTSRRPIAISANARRRLGRTNDAIASYERARAN